MRVLRTYVIGKLHGIRVTGASVDYFGSVTIDRDLLDRAGVQPHEQVHIVNLANGNRWVTYALPGDPGVFTLNGGSAYLGAVGDPCVVMVYGQAKRAPGARVVFLDEQNRPDGKGMIYPAGGWL